jgi:hypothetical protein
MDEQFTRALRTTGVEPSGLKKGSREGAHLPPSLELRYPACGSRYWFDLTSRFESLSHCWARSMWFVVIGMHLFSGAPRVVVVGLQFAQQLPTDEQFVVFSRNNELVLRCVSSKISHSMTRRQC